MKKEVTYKSHDQITTIHATIWIPTIPIKGIVQVSHGMIECMAKYEEFACILNQEGYIVCGEDHLGHGKSAIDRNHRGYIAKKKPEEILVDDAHTLTRIIKKEYPGLQVFMLGFSFGSFIARNYMGKYGKELSGVVLIGSTVVSNLQANFFLFNAHLQKYFCGGEQKYSRSLEKQTIGKFPNYFANNQFKLCWLSKDYKALDRYYRNNPDTDFKFSINGFITLARSIKLNNKRKTLKNIPKELPVLILSGKDDPATHFAKDVIKLEKKYNNLGLVSVRAKHYNEARHDLLMEKERDIIINEIVRFIKLKADPTIRPIMPPKVIKTVAIKTVKANFNNINAIPKKEEPVPVEEKPIETPPVVEEPKETVVQPTEGKKKKKKKKHQQENTPVEVKEETPKEEEVKAEEPKKEEKKPESKEKPAINFDEPQEEKKEESKKEKNKVQPSINFDEETPSEPVNNGEKKKDKKRKKKDKAKTKEEIENEKLKSIQNDDGVFDEMAFENLMTEDKK